MKDRIKKIQEYSGLSLGVFASRTGIKSASLSHILNGRNNPSLDVVMKIHETFPEVSWEWMLYGTGSMLIGGNPNSAENKQVESVTPPSTASSERTIFDNDPAKSDEFFEMDDNSDLDNLNDDSSEDDPNVSKTEPVKIEPEPVSKPVETIVTPQKSESEIIESFLKSDLYQDMIEKNYKTKEKSVKKIIVLYDDETFAEYSLNKL